jgi:DNA-binding NarL/FixJ family response regulator
MPAEKIRVLVVDDHAVMREGISAIINAQPDMSVVGEADNGEEAIQEFHRLQPHITIVDINLPVVSGIEVMASILGEKPMARFIVVSSLKDDRYILEAFNAGAQAFLHKHLLRRELIPAMRVVHEGRQYNPPGFSG